MKCPSSYLFINWGKTESWKHISFGGRYIQSNSQQYGIWVWSKHISLYIEMIFLIFTYLRNVEWGEGSKKLIFLCGNTYKEIWSPIRCCCWCDDILKAPDSCQFRCFRMRVESITISRKWRVIAFRPQPQANCRWGRWRDENIANGFTDAYWGDWKNMLIPSNSTMSHYPNLQLFNKVTHNLGNVMYFISLKNI